MHNTKRNYFMSKTLKQVFAILLSIAIIFAVAVTAIAADPPYTITINNGSSAVSMTGITYNAYTRCSM